jgi:hypothetical protein
VWNRFSPDLIFDHNFMVRGRPSAREITSFMGFHSARGVNKSVSKQG